MPGCEKFLGAPGNSGGGRVEFKALLSGIAVAIGLIALPALSAYLILSDYSDDMNHHSELDVENLIQLVADGMRDPVRNLDPQGGAAIVDSFEADPRFVSVEVTSVVQGKFLSYVRPGAQPDAVPENRTPVMFDGQQIGEVRARVDPARLSAADDNRWVRMFSVVAVQLLFSVGAVLLLIRLTMKLVRNRTLSTVNRELQAEIEERKRYSGALQNSEQQMRDILNALPMSVFYVDTDLCVRAANRVCQEWWGRSEEELLGVRFHESFDEQRAATFEKLMSHTFAGNTWELSPNLGDGVMDQAAA